MTWRIELADTGAHYAIDDALAAHLAWKRLSKAAQEAVEAAYPDLLVRGHKNTLAALQRHGLTECPWPNTCPTKPYCHRPKLTEAGKAVAKWCVKQ